jgi:hypothetical protein
MNGITSLNEHELTIRFSLKQEFIEIFHKLESELTPDFIVNNVFNN